MKKIFHAASFSLLTAALCVAPDAAAVKFGADTRLTTTTNIPGANNGSSLGPRITAFNGVLHLVWVEYPANCGAAGEACGEIFYMRSLDNGFNWETPQRLTTDVTTDRFPSVAASAKGVVLIWNTDFASGGLRYTRSAAGAAGTWAAPAMLWDGVGYSHNPEVVADLAGDFHVTWYDSANSADVGRIFYTCSTDAFASGAPYILDLSQHDGSVDSETPTLAVAPDGNMYLAFRSTRNGDPQGGWSPYQQYVMRMRAKDCTSGSKQPKNLWVLPPQKLSPGLPEDYRSVYAGVIAPGNNGRMHAAYWDNKHGNNVTYQQGFPGGIGWRPPATMSAFGLNSPQIGAGAADIAAPGLTEDAAGRLHLFWYAETNIDEGSNIGYVHYRESADGGTSFGPDVLLSDQPSAMTPKATSHNGRVHVVWADFRANDTSSEIWYKSASIFPKGDSTSDGRADLFWRDSSMGLSWWQMSSNTLQNSNFFNVGNEWVVKRVGDMNGDGKADIIWRREGGLADGAAYLWTLNGLAPLGFFDLGILPMSQWDLQGVGDLNGDGRDDIVWRNKLDGSVYVWLMNGGTIIGQATAGVVGLEWVINDVKDVNGDGRADIIFRRTSDGAVFIWFMNGTTLASSGGPGALDPATWDLMGAGDFNGDLKADLLWRNKITGDVWIWLMNGAAILNSASIGNPGTSWNIRAIADLNGDGRADIVLRQGTTSTYAWMMNGFTIIQQGNISNPGGTWQLVGP